MRHKTGFVIGLFSILVIAAALGMLVPVEQAKLTASDGEAGNEFGVWVGIDGKNIVLGAPSDDNLTGSAYIFQRNRSGWTEVAKLTAGDGEDGDNFGYAVAIDGNTAVVTAPFHDDVSGSAYIFWFYGGSWTQQAELTASDREADDFFGHASVIDRHTAVITSFNDDDLAGAAYVFQRQGSTWTEVAKLTASDRSAGDVFGEAAAIDGNTVVITAWWDDDLGTDSGSAYVFQQQGSAWTEVAKLTASDGEAYDNFGTSVAIDGDFIAIAAHKDDDLGTDAGAVYIFQRQGSTWREITKLTASDGASFDQLGLWQVALDQDNLIVGAFREDSLGDDSGAAYLFRREGREWTQVAKLTASDGEAHDWFGFSVAIDGDNIIVVAPEDDDLGVDSGSAYIFQLVIPAYP